MVVPAIFRVKQSKKTLKMKVLSFFEMSATTFQTKQSYIPEKLNLQESGNKKIQIAQNLGYRKQQKFLTRWTSVSTYKKNSCIFCDATVPSGPDPPHYRGFTIGFLWTSDQVDTETSIWRRTALKRDRHPYPRRDSNPQCRHGSGHRLTPQSARPLGSKKFSYMQLVSCKFYETVTLL